ncbi:hypothetical protein [Salipiger mucosus]|uniref:DNA mismatch repair protein MutL n=1 Tax=Salipiger mucosus DSM 16094 TaxID=1123237 RepID=S9QWZ6_9RHOB|nr:hypothetical protein [Salipiger mucosus]EPX84113.1 DNA mismatch repair protein MutL [Salipiger mucosus DSM 16094]
MQRVALQHPEISFSLKYPSQVKALQATDDPQRRCGDVLGSDFRNNATPVDVQFTADGEDWALSGWILPLAPGGRATERSRVCSVGQFLLDVPEIETAVKHVWKTVFSVGNRNFSYVLSLCPVNGTRNVNYNAHPQKKSVIFREGAGIMAALETALHDALREDAPGAFQHNVVAGTGSIPGDAVDLEDVDGPLGRPIGQYKQGFILSEAAGGLIVVDQHAAHEKMLMERMLEENRDPDFSSARLDNSVLVADDIGAQMRLEEIEAELGDIGIELRHDGTETYLVAAPVLQGASLDPASLVQALSEEVPSRDVVRRLAFDLANKACKRAIKNGTELTLAQMSSFLRQMEAMPSSATCNHGRPTIHRIGHNQLIGLFDRAA